MSCKLGYRELPVADLGEGARGPAPPLFLDQTEDWRAEKNIFGDPPRPPLPPTPKFLCTPFIGHGVITSPRSFRGNQGLGNEFKP